MSRSIARYGLMALLVATGGCTITFFRTPILILVGPTQAIAVPESSGVVAAGQPYGLNGENSYLLLGSGDTLSSATAGFTYAWDVVATPENAVQPAFSAPTSAQTLFTATTPGDYVVRLTVTNGLFTGATDLVIHVL